MKVFKDLYQYRELLKTTIKKEIRGKYKGSFLGILWSFVNPLLMVLVYSIVFPFILRSSEANYVIFLIVGIIPWNWFTTVIGQGVTTILGNGNIIKKVYFPREVLPIAVATSGLINFFISNIIILIFLIGSGVGISFYLLLLPLVAAIQYALSLGIIFILSAINVYIRDAEYIVNFFIMMLFYGTPILYSSTMFPEKYRWLLSLNPMTHIIEAYRDIFYYQQLPNLQSLLIVAVGSFCLLVIGYRIFKKLEKGFAEEL
jgi:ABC-type polysaccharide/polyol phosphate export permease